MSSESGPTASTARDLPPIRFVDLHPEALAALLNRDLAGASALTGLSLPDYFQTDGALWLWKYRLDQLASDPAGAAWIGRSAVTNSDGEVVGHAGFHGPPDDAGMVEIGYSVVPEHRRQGYATAILTEQLRLAGESPEVQTVRATISPDNLASLATIAGFGFAEVGEQWDEEDGLETIFEVSVAGGS